jgi:hypothetical protein
MLMINATWQPVAKLAPLVLFTALLGACGGESGEDQTGTASFAVTDAPRDDVSNVFITFDRIAIKPAEGEAQTFELDDPQRLDLLTLQGGNAASLIEDIEVPAGQYNWIRLYVVGGIPDSQVTETDTGGEFGLYVPGNQPHSQNPNQRWIQLSSPFTVPPGGSADFVIDVDLRKALVKRDPPQSGEPFYMIRPSLRLADRAEVATISGTVDAALIEGNPDCSQDGDGEQDPLYERRDRHRRARTRGGVDAPEIKPLPVADGVALAGLVAGADPGGRVQRRRYHPECEHTAKCYQGEGEPLAVHDSL